MSVVLSTTESLAKKEKNLTEDLKLNVDLEAQNFLEVRNRELL